MGVYDSFQLDNPIKCNCGEEINDFQTKSLDCDMIDFFVRKNDVLECLDYSYEDLPTDERDPLGFPRCKKVIHGYKVVKGFNKAVNIYSSCSQGKCWIDVGLLFENGILIGKTVTISKSRLDSRKNYLSLFD